MTYMTYLKDVVTLQLYEEKCTGCGQCLIVCPHAVLARSNGRMAVVNRDACMECGACVRNCPAEAIQVQVGVGCAQAVINSMLGRQGSSCCCVIDSSPGDSGAASRQGGGNTSGLGCC
jgi:ferredoxin